VKPEVCAVGVKSVLVNPGGTIVDSNGTSFATPLIAGMAACIWSALPEENAMQIRERIIRSADRYGNPDKEQYGYGIPDAWKAYSMTLPTEIEEVVNQNSKVENSKVLRNGQIVIIRDGKTYDIFGRLVD
jgi:subtilisin family serine protease